MSVGRVGLVIFEWTVTDCALKFQVAVGGTYAPSDLLPTSAVMKEVSWVLYTRTVTGLRGGGCGSARSVASADLCDER